MLANQRESPSQYKTPYYNEEEESYSEEGRLEESRPWNKKQTLFYFKHACLQIALTSLHRLRMKIIFSSKAGLVDYVVELYREMLRFNH